MKKNTLYLWAGIALILGMGVIVLFVANYAAPIVGTN
jgi:uncharacterized membrane protein